ncbi:MAG: hypothetical protein IT581_08185 [Verrucomicrobiales bacterium]|nr:hypothetical protein [Verrucomicrobiales bacterium]
MTTTPNLTTPSIDTLQMEMGLAANSRRRRPATNRHPRRTGAARWWFAQMREAVRSARTWETTEPMRTPFEQEQLFLQSPMTRLQRSPASV